MSIILEKSRNQLVAKSKTDSEKSRQRYKRRVKSRVGNTVKQFNRLNMDKLFKQDILDVNIPVEGETDTYIVRISFGGILSELQKELNRNQSEDVDLRLIIRALMRAFNGQDVYIHCSCPDSTYRYSYWQTKDKVNSGNPESRPSDITNPENNLGSGCKHTLLVLSNTAWLIKVASVIRNYISYMQKHMSRLYADIIYPAIFNKAYEEPVQQDLFDDELDTDEETIDQANIEAKEKGRFKAGNEYRIPAADKVKDQITIDDITDEDDEYKEVDDWR